MARAYASMTFPISVAASPVVFGGAALTGGALDDVALAGTAPGAAPPFAGGFTVGCVVFAGATFGGGGETDAPEGVGGAGRSCARCSAGVADDDDARRSLLLLGACRGRSVCGWVDDWEAGD